MTSERQFYLNTTTVVWLSEEPPEVAYDGTLEGLGHRLSEGPCVMHTYSEGGKRVDPAEMARLLDEAGSEAGFFGLTDKGEDDPNA